MKKFFVYTMMIAFGITLTLTSCKKYEDGPLISLASKKSRVVNNWKMEKALLAMFDVTSLFTGFEMELKTNNTYVITWPGGATAETGSWEFDSAKENIITTPDGSAISTSWKILKLKSSELWVNYTDGTYVYEFHLVSA